MGLFDAFLPSFLLAYDVGRLWPLKLRYVINLRAAADVAAPKGVLLPHEHDNRLLSLKSSKCLKNSVSGPTLVSQAECFKIEGCIDGAGRLGDLRPPQR